MGSSPCALHNVAYTPQQVILDDDSAQIRYEGGWVADSGTVSTSLGASYNATTHRLNVTHQTSSILFDFQGTAFSILGIPIAGNPTTANGGYSYNATCLVDGQNNFNHSNANLLCGYDNLKDGTHQVNFSATASPDNALTLIVDGIQYTPTATELSDSHPGVLIIDVCDPLVDFGQTAASWSMIKPPDALPGDPSLGFGSESRGISTSVSGTEIRYEFVGTKITALATILSVHDGGSSTSTTGHVSVSLDGVTSDFEVPSSLPTFTSYNHPIYESDDLTPGKHTLVMTYNGDQNSVPLSLSYFIVHPTWSTSTAKSRIGPILGGVLGGVFGLILALVVAWIGYSRRQRRLEKRAWSMTWRNRTNQSDAIEMISSPKPEKTDI
jgi:hypothetical protein